MIIEVRKQGERKKYYLAHSFREGGKVRKIRRYLGRDLSEKQLNELKKRAEEIIKQQIEEYKKISDPLKTMLSDKELNFLKNLELKANINIKHLSNEEWEIFTELFTYNTNAIEGSEANEKDVKQILQKDKWPENVTKEDISETYGVSNAIKHIRKIKKHLSIELIKKLHYITFKNSKNFAGKFREKGVEVVVSDRFGNIMHRGAPSNSVLGLLKELINWYKKNRNNYPPILLAAVVHNQFENIHPFKDGNGRVGRLLLNNILLKHDMPPVNISFKNRREYYASLQEYEKKGNIRPTLELILKEYKLLKKELGAYKKRNK